MDSKINIVILGGPGSAKGTSGTFLGEKMNVKHLSTGESYRKHMKDETPIGLKVKQAISDGGLADDETTVDMTRGEIRELVECGLPINGYIFDGFPRTLSQGPLLDSLLGEFDMKVDLVIYLKETDAVLLKRIKARAKTSGRLEDLDIDYTKTRIKVFHEQTKPLIDFYKERGILVTIDKCKDANVLENRLVDILTEKGLL